MAEGASIFDPASPPAESIRNVAVLAFVSPIQSFASLSLETQTVQLD